MTGQEIFETACAFLFEQPGADADFKAHALPLLNLCIAEALPYENAIRHTHGDTELTAAPRLISLEDEIPFFDAICHIALPYGLASYFFQDECDNYKAQDFRARFIDALSEAAEYCEESIENAYTTEA